MIYVTSDCHYFHRNIIKYCDRPFADLEIMKRTLISNHNSVVNEEDEVYNLGDFAMLLKDQITKIKPILEALNGKQHLIMGNHDENHPRAYINMGFISVHTSLYIDDFLLMHDPSGAVCVNSKQKILCGHLHQITKKPAKNVLNVGVDIWDYKPVNLEFIKKNWATF